MNTTTLSHEKSKGDDRGERRERILAAAANVFGYSGFAKAMVDEIAKRAGVGKGAVYQVAESKEELYMLTVEREVRVWHEATAALIDETVPAEELLVRVAGAAMQTVYTNPLLRDLFCGETANLLAKCEDRLRDLRGCGAEHLTTVLRIGMRQGAWRDDLDPQVAAGILQDIWIGLWMLEPTHLTDHARMMRLTSALELVLGGLRSRVAKVA